MTPDVATSRQARQARRACLLAVLLVAGCSAPADRPLLGYVEGEYVRIAAPFAGQLQQLSVRRGGEVAVGAPVFALERDNEVAARRQAEQQLQSALARLDNLNQIAAAGGTDQAYLVQGADVQGAILDALNAIRAQAAIPCQLRTPSDPNGGTLNFSTVNIAYCDGTGASQTFFNVGTQGSCDPQLGGWYYDDNNNPTQILLCEASCGTVSQPGGTLVLSIGCETEVIPR